MSEATPLPIRDRLQRSAGVGAGFDFHNDQEVALERRQIHLAEGRAGAVGEEAIALGHQPRASQPFRPAAPPLGGAAATGRSRHGRSAFNASARA